MDLQQLQQYLDGVFDLAIVYHAFTPYMRDYEVIVYVPANPSTGKSPFHLRYLFRYCAEADVKSALEPDAWRRSLDERLIVHETAHDLDGFVWGVNFQNLYPGMELVSPSKRAVQWSTDVGIEFHEVHITTEAQMITLIFSDLEVSEIPLGYAPFTTSD